MRVLIPMFLIIFVICVAVSWISFWNPLVMIGLIVVLGLGYLLGIFAAVCAMINGVFEW